ncbi:PH domain-containing protein [Lentibacillus kimchii]
MHPLWMLFSFISSIKELILIVVFFIVIIGINFDSIYAKLGIAVMIFYLVYKPISIILDWRHFEYFFTDNEICINEGRFIKKKRFIPLDYIQGINRKTTVFYRVFGLTTLLINAGSSINDSSIKLKAISNEEATRIQAFLDQFDSLKNKSEQNEQIPADPTSKHSFKENHYKITSKEMFIASIISLRFIIFIAVIYSVYAEIANYISVDNYINAVISFFQQSWPLTLLGIVALLALSLVYGISKTYLQYRNFTVSSDLNRIFIQKGLFNTTEFSIPKEKVQAINLHATFIQRAFRFVRVKMVSVSDMDEEEMKTSNTLFPFIKKDRATLLISEILPEFTVELEMISIPRKAIFMKLVRSSYLWIAGPAVIISFWPELWYIALSLFVIVITSQLISSFQSKYKLNPPFIQFQRGGFLTRLFVTKRTKIEELKITESLLQQKLGLASVQISTRASPIKLAKISDIPKDVALQYYQWYANQDIDFKQREYYC